MRILVVEDDAKMAELLRRGLSREGHAVDIEGDGVRGLEKGQTQPFDAIVLDIMLPGMDGLYVARRLRSSGVRTPILMLTARDSVPDIVRGLDVGADDYLTEPFSFEVLDARLRVIARRTAADAGSTLQVADLTLDTRTHECAKETWNEVRFNWRSPHGLVPVYAGRRPGGIRRRELVRHAGQRISHDRRRAGRPHPRCR